MSITPSLSNWFLMHLPASDRSWLDPHLHTIPVLTDQLLQRRGDDQAYVILPQSAIIALGVPGPDGGFTEAAVLGQEGMLGGLAAAASAPALHTACVRVRGDVARIAKPAFRAALDHSAAIRELTARCDAFIMAQVQQSACCNALHSVEARLCRWLLQMDDRGLGGRLPLTQDLLAQSLGVRRTTITLVAGKLQATGSISWKRGCVQIVNRRYLEQHVCRCYGWLRRLSDTLLPRAGFNGMEVQQQSRADQPIGQLTN